MADNNKKRIAVSLFCSSGIGDLGLQANNVNTVVACELLPERMRLFLHNHPTAKGFCGNIWELKDDIIRYYKENFSENPFIVIATPPCQGMSVANHKKKRRIKEKLISCRVYKNN